MCAGCFIHLLADSRLKEEQATCPNCRYTPKSSEDTAFPEQSTKTFKVVESEVACYFSKRWQTQVNLSNVDIVACEYDI